MSSCKSKSSIFTKVGIESYDGTNFNPGMKIRVATDTGVRKTILNRSDWRKIEDYCLLVKTKIKFRP